VTQIGALLAPECFKYLHPRSQIHDVIRVRKYTIRFTSYGPPHEHLQFVLQAVDWLGHHSGGHQEPNSDELKPLWSEELVDIARRLHNTRAREDRRCLGPHISPNSTPEQEADAPPAVMAGSDDSSQAASQLLTQMEFGTQLPHAVRARPVQDAPQFLGVNRLEPVLAGNTQREEIRPVTPKSVSSGLNNRDKLLSLLGKTVNAGIPKSTTGTMHVTKPSPGRSSCTNVDKPPRSTYTPGTQLLTQLPVSVNQHVTQSQAASTSVELTSPKHVPAKQRDRDILIVSPHAERRAQQHVDRVAAAQRNEESQLQKLASECSWMQDFEFTRENFKVPSEQLNILRKNDSWHKPMPGYRFPDGNVPINILTTLYRLADENAAMDAAPDSEDGMTEDPSPEFPVESVDASVESVPQPNQDDPLPSSQISWSASPSPEPPILPTRSNQQLPPDSSFEPAEPATDDDVTSRIQDPILIDSSNEDERIDPPSSPPMRDVPAEMEDDMEMEEFVPQGLGEDSIGGADQPKERKVLAASLPPGLVVQVKETPCVRGKHGPHNIHTDNLHARRLSCSSTSKDASSTLIVYGTYNDNSSLCPQIIASRAGVSVPTTDMDQGVESLELEQTQQESTRGTCRGVLDDAVIDVNTIDTTMTEAPCVSIRQQPVALEHELPMVSPGRGKRSIVLPELTPMSAQMPSNMLGSLAVPGPSHAEERPTTREISNRADLSKSPSQTPGPAKRKHDNSPSRRNSRHSKRREIKIMGFDDDPPDSTDPASAALHYREESLRKFREARTSSARTETGPVSATNINLQQGPNAMQINSRAGAPAPPLSPRHDSLYRESSPALPVPTVAPAAALHSTSNTLPIAPRPHFPEPSASTSQAPSGPGSDRGKASSIFESFKAAYAEYTGDTKHFQGQCLQMIKLDQEDKMVPKWQWDDFIIRNRTDYKEYAIKCLGRGEDPEPYHRFYKDTICDTIYRRGVIEGRSTLLRALQQLNVQVPPQADLGSSPIKPSKKEKRARASLPSAFSQVEPAIKGHRDVTAHARPRHSLPSRPPQHHQTPSTNLHAPKVRAPPSSTFRHVAASEHSTPRPNVSSRLSLDGTASPRTTPGPGQTIADASDPFRDFVFAYQRTTSLTGSTRVSSTANRNKGRKS
jgi:ribosomal protein S30